MLRVNKMLISPILLILTLPALSSCRQDMTRVRLVYGGLSSMHGSYPSASIKSRDDVPLAVFRLVNDSDRSVSIEGPVDGDPFYYLRSRNERGESRLYNSHCHDKVVQIIVDPGESFEFRTIVPRHQPFQAGLGVSSERGKCWLFAREKTTWSAPVIVPRS